jgi:hypothetical protein
LAKDPGDRFESAGALAQAALAAAAASGDPSPPPGTTAAPHRRPGAPDAPTAA